MRGRLAALGFALCVSPAPALAEEAVYGEVDLTGLARLSWPLNNFAEQNAMVCNVNGPDGYLAIRAAPDAGAEALRKLNRLAIVVVDVTARDGHWIRVVDAYREVTPDGVARPLKMLSVQGWAHDDYLCDYIH
jgi:hypothetical protein